MGKSLPKRRYRMASGRRAIRCSESAAFLPELRHAPAFIEVDHGFPIAHHWVMARVLPVSIALALSVVLPVLGQTMVADTAQIRIELVGQPGVLWKYTAKDSGQTFDVSPPRFEVDGRTISGVLTDIRASRLTDDPPQRRCRTPLLGPS